LALSTVPHHTIDPLPLPKPPAPARRIQDYEQGGAKHNDANRESTNGTSLWERITDDAVAFTTLCLVGVTAVLAVSTIGLWIVTAKGSKKQSKDMQRSIRVAERALVSVERAFVFVKGYAQIPQTGHDVRVREWAVMPILHNSGSTPTRHMLTHVSIETRDDELPDDFDFPDKGPPDAVEEPKNPLAFVGPKADLWMPALAINVVDLDKINPGRKKIYIYGWIDYDDVFPHAERHRTEFCLEIIGVSPDYMTPAGAPIAMRHYKKHNGADDECFRRPRAYSARHSGQLAMKRRLCRHSNRSVLLAWRNR